MSDAGSHGQAVLGFDLDPAPAFSREAFHVSSANRRAFTLLDAWPEWPAPFLNLVGPDGAGKSHLARIWAEKASAYFVDLSSLEGIGPGQRAVIDDVDAPTAAQQNALFHLYNRLMAGGGLLLVSHRPLSRLATTTADLASRLRAVPVAEIAPPDDALLEAVLRKRFDDRQLAVEQSVIDYLVSRMDRSFTALEAIVRRLDELALSRKRAVTVPLVREVLARTSSQISLKF